jgi:hypothetical protein
MLHGFGIPNMLSLERTSLLPLQVYGGVQSTSEAADRQPDVQGNLEETDAHRPV